MLGHFVHSSVFVACQLTIINILCNLKLVEISFDAQAKSTKVGKIREASATTEVQYQWCEFLFAHNFKY